MVRKSYSISQTTSGTTITLVEQIKNTVKKKEEEKIENRNISLIKEIEYCKQSKHGSNVQTRAVPTSLTLGTIHEKCRFS